MRRKHRRFTLTATHHRTIHEVEQENAVLIEALTAILECRTPEYLHENGTPPLTQNDLQPINQARLVAWHALKRVGVHDAE